MITLCGCASTQARSDTAASVAVAFHEAIAAHDGAAACHRLAPATAAELQDSDQVCVEAILDLDLPHGQGVTHTETWGLAAQVRLNDDVIFLTTVHGEWKITAAGCVAAAPGPYSCEVSGA